MTGVQKSKAQWSYIQRTYGLTQEQYDELNLGYCPICLRSFSDTVIPVVDHDHVDSMVRGIVCRYCNHRRIGHHRDSSILRRIADYIDNAIKFPMPPKKKKKRKKNARKSKS